MSCDMQAHTMIVSRLTYRYCCFCYLCISY